MKSLGGIFHSNSVWLIYRGQNKSGCNVRFALSSKISMENPEGKNMHVCKDAGIKWRTASNLTGLENMVRMEKSGR